MSRLRAPSVPQSRRRLEHISKRGRFVDRATAIADFAELDLGLAEGKIRGLDPGYARGA